VDVSELDEVSDERYAYVWSIWMKSEGEKSPVPVAGRAATSVPVYQYKYCKLIMHPTYWAAILNFWRRKYFFLILAHPVYKMLIKQETNMLEL